MALAWWWLISQKGNLFKIYYSSGNPFMPKYYFALLCTFGDLKWFPKVWDVSEIFGQFLKNFQSSILAWMDFPNCQYVPAASSSEQFFNQWSYLDLVIFSYFLWVCFSLFCNYFWEVTNCQKNKKGTLTLNKILSNIFKLA